MLRTIIVGAGLPAAKERRLQGLSIPTPSFGSGKQERDEAGGRSNNRPGRRPIQAKDDQPPQNAVQDDTWSD